MNQPWGLSGPQFLGVYAGALVASLVCLAVLLARIKRGQNTDRAPVDVYTMAALGGGAGRVVDTAVLALIEDGHLRASRDHQLTVCGAQFPAEPVQYAVLGTLGPKTGARLGEIRRRGAATYPVRRIVEGAVAQGLLLDSRRRRTAWATLLLPFAVLCVGVARLVNGIRLDRPVGLLFGLLIVTVFVMAGAAAAVPSRTRAGDRLYKEARRARDAAPGLHVFGSYGATGRAVPAAVMGVALLGAVGVEDEALRTAVYGSAATSSGGGSGCGGSGCGGGGCGGCGG